MTIEGLLETAGANALSATFLFAAALVAQRFVTRPAIRHLLWLAVVVRLLLPPILALPVPAPSFPRAPAAGGDAVEVAAVVASRDFAPLPAPARGATPAAAALPASLPAAATDEARGEPAGVLAAEPARRDAEPRLLPLAFYLAIVQLGGAVAVLGIATHRWTRFRRALGTLRPAAAPLVDRVRELAAHIGVQRVPRVALTDAAVPPFLFPAPAMTLVLPERLLHRLDDDERDALLAHELTHVRRGDPWIRPLELVATALYWWFPLLPLARARLRAAEEAACDRDVVRAFPGKARAYAEGLLKTVELSSHPGSTPALATGAADSRELKERIMAIFHPAPRPALPRWRRALAMLPLLAAVSLTPAWVERDAPTVPKAPPRPEWPEMPVSPEAPEALRLPMIAPVFPMPERIPVAPRALAAPPMAPLPPIAPMTSLLRTMASEAPMVDDPSMANDREMLEAELAHRRAELEMQRELMAMHVKQNEMRWTYEDLARKRELEALSTQLEVMERVGQTRQAAELRRAYALEHEQFARETELRKVELVHQQEQRDLELAIMAAEIRQQEASLRDDREAMKAAEDELRELTRRNRKLELENMRLGVERARADLEAQQAAYERMAQELSEEDEGAEPDGSAGSDKADD